ncbi:MAG TPA: cupin domain-containing protein [Mucilaginibacter sp.]
MDIDQYIGSGILEAYCLGLLTGEEQADVLKITALYPEVKAELDAVELSFEQLANLTAVEPANHLKGRLLASIDFGADDFSLSADDLPVLSASQSPQPWLDLFAHLIPEEPVDAFNVNVIRDDAIVQQMLITANTDAAEEEHSEFYEGLFILKGSCVCVIGGEVYALGPGDFVEMPLNTKHNVTLTTPFVTAVLQYRFV